MKGVHVTQISLIYYSIIINALIIINLIISVILLNTTPIYTIETYKHEISLKH